MRLVAVLVFFGLAWTLGLAAGATESGVTTDEAALSWVPPSTSYLPMYRGPLTRRNGEGPNSAKAKTLAPAEVQDSRNSVAERFDELRAKVLGESQPLAPVMQAELYDPKLNLLNGPWEGFCDGWSAWAGGDPALVELTEHMSDLSCQGVFLSKGEIRELITAFYPSETEVDEKGNSLAWGPHYRAAVDPRIVSVRNAIGIDSLSAVFVDQTLYKYLKENHGLVFDIHAPPQIWNYPVYAASSRTVEVDASGLRLLPPLDATDFTLRGPGTGDAAKVATNLLATYNWAHKALQTYTYTIDGSEHEKETDPVSGKITSMPIFIPSAVAETVKNRGVWTKNAYDGNLTLGYSDAPYESLIANQVEGLLAMHAMLYRKVLESLDSGVLGLNADIRIRHRWTRIWNSKESGFAAQSDTPNGRIHDYEYVLIDSVKDPTQRRGLWITPSVERPAVIWIPKSLATPGAGNPYRSVVPDWLLTKSSDGSFKHEGFQTYSPLGALYDILQRCGNSTR
jgi:hypothetical protein